MAEESCSKTMQKETPPELKGNAFDYQVIKRLFTFITPYKHLFYILVLLTILTGALAPVRPYIIQLTIDKYILTNNYAGLWTMVMLMTGLLFIHSGVQYAQSYVSAWLGQHFVHDLRGRLYKHLIVVEDAVF